MSNSQTVAPDPKHTTDDNFVKWYDQRAYSSKVGSLGMRQATVGKIMKFDEFKKTFSGLQSK
jgi:hypothetical protein